MKDGFEESKARVRGVQVEDCGSKDKRCTHRAIIISGV